MQNLGTRLIHGGEPRPRIHGSINVPLFQSSTYLTDSEVGYDEIKYLRLGNTPGHEALQAKLAAIMDAEAALVSASGMAAISSVIFGLLQRGDHMLIEESLYGGTFDLLTKDCHRFGIEFDFIDSADPAAFPARLKPNTRMIYVESITNPCLKVADFPAVTAFAKANGLLAVCDNTFASPVNFRALAAGFDLELHSATKYLNGHSDITAGVVAGSHALVRAVHHFQNRSGGVLDPNSVYLLYRGLKTLHVRQAWQNESALRLARALAGHGGIRRVLYPGLEDDPNHARAKSSFTGGFGGMISFELRSADAGTFINALNIPLYAPSLGGVESLVTLPARTSHSAMPEATRRRLGITPGFVRMSVGLESPDDLIADVLQAIERGMG